MKKERWGNQNKKNEVSPFFFSTQKMANQRKRGQLSHVPRSGQHQKNINRENQTQPVSTKNIKPISQHLEVPCQCRQKKCRTQPVSTKNQCIKVPANLRICESANLRISSCRQEIFRDGTPLKSIELMSVHLKLKTFLRNNPG